jgi:SAM-dependent methyltransferase
LQRVVEAEWLDSLPPHDPRAQRSRADLRRVNFLMGNAGHIARALRRPPDKGVASRRRTGGWFSEKANPPLASLATPLSGGQGLRIADLGAGDGSLMLRVARRLRCKGVELTLVDRAPSASIADFERIGWRASIAREDALAFLCRPGPRFDAIVCNLFLHHFEPEALRRLLEAAAQRTALFLACEPRRSGLALQASRLLGLLGCNAVTRHDARASVRAGFRAQELTASWPGGCGWQLAERPAAPFGHLFSARRHAPL